MTRREIHARSWICDQHGAQKDRESAVGPILIVAFVVILVIGIFLLVNKD